MEILIFSYFIRSAILLKKIYIFQSYCENQSFTCNSELFWTTPRDFRKRQNFHGEDCKRFPPTIAPNGRLRYISLYNITHSFNISQDLYHKNMVANP